MKENFSITQKGKALAKSKYTIDVKGKTFSSRESNLVLDFNGLHDWTFKTGDFCTFKTGNNCTLKTDNHCTFDTGENCTFMTGNYCTFSTYSHCNFNTGSCCIFTTSDKCIFITSNNCTFLLWDINSCKFKSFGENNIISDRRYNKRYLLNKDLIDTLKVMKG